MNWLRRLFCDHSWEMVIDDDDEDLWRRNFMRYFVCRKCNKTKDRMR